MATSSPSPAPAPKGKRYRALTPVDYNNKRYEIGKTLELDADAAEPLLARSAIERAGKDADDAEAA